jgi:hypothetical protein
MRKSLHVAKIADRGLRTPLAGLFNVLVQAEHRYMRTFTMFAYVTFTYS